MQHYDLIIIGAGSAGISVAEIAAAAGTKVLLVENKHLGGTCVNLGCVPKKIMWYATEITENLKLASSFGFDVEQKSFNWKTLITQRDNYIQNILSWYESYLYKNNIDLVFGTTSFDKVNSISVTPEMSIFNKHQVSSQTTLKFNATKVIIATGSTPLVPKNIEGYDLGLTSDDFFNLDKQPKKIAIIGSGYIALELASMLSSLNSEVHLIVRNQTLLKNFDQDLVAELINQLKQNINLKIYFNTTIINATKKGDNKILKLNKDNELTILEVDNFIWAIGREAKIQNLKIQELGVKIDNSGFIEVDTNHKTNLDNLYAMGDVCGDPQLTPFAIKIARYWAHRQYNNAKDLYVSYEHIPTVIFTHPPLATIGLTQEKAELKYQKNKIEVYTSRFTPMFYSLGNTKKDTLIKLIVRKLDDRVLGLQLLGYCVDEILQGFATAIAMGATKKDFDNSLAIHPTSAEEVVTLK